MCYHVSNHKDKNIIKKVFKAKFDQEDDFKVSYHVNGFDKPLLPFISNEDAASIQLFRWRLVPSTVSDESAFLANTLNARAEDLLQKSSYKAYWQNRGLVICSGFFEPHKAAGIKQSQAYYIKPKHEEFFRLGAIWAKWKDQYTCSIITLEASPFMAEIHNEGKRMPLMLSNDAAQQWLQKDLSQEDMKKLMSASVADEQVESYRVMDGIMNARKNTNIPEAIKPLENALGQISLF